MAEFDVGEFLRQKRIQDAVNAHDPSYNPDDATHWISAAQKIQEPDVTSNPNLAQPINDSGTIDPSIGDQAITQSPTFKAPVIGPEESAYRQQLGQTPLRSDYHPRMLRRILGGVAGVGMGLATSDPTKALATEDTIKDAPYNKKLSEFQQGLGIQQQKAQAEIGDVSRAATQQELEARRQAEEERAAAERARRDKFIYDTSETAHARKLEELKIQHGDKAVFHEVKLKDGTIVYAKRDPLTGKLINTDNNLPIDMKAVDTLSDPNKSLKQTADEKIPAALQAGIKAREIIADPKQQGTPAFEAAQEYLKNLAAGKDPKTAFDAVKDKTNEERKAKGQPEMSSSELTALAKQLQPDQKFSTLMINPANNQVINPKPGQVLPLGVRTLAGESQTNTPTTPTRGKAEQANTVIHAGEDLKNFIDQNKAKLGKIGDYWQQIASGTPVADPDIAEFQTRIASYAALQAAAHGFRGANVMKDFEGKLGGPARNPEAIKRAIDGITATMNEIAKTGGGSIPTSNAGWSVKVVK